jgi:hypothetical protein
VGALEIVETRLSKANEAVDKQDEIAGRVCLSYFVDVILPALGLSQWTVWLEHDAAPINGALAEIAPDPEDHYIARLRISSDALRATRERRRGILLHEGIHLRYLPVTEYIRGTLAKALGQQVYDVLWEGFRQQYERETDGIARALEPLLPLPDDDYLTVPEAGPGGVLPRHPQGSPQMGRVG